MPLNSRWKANTNTGRKKLVKGGGDRKRSRQRGENISLLLAMESSAIALWPVPGKGGLSISTQEMLILQL